MSTLSILKAEQLSQGLDATLQFYSEGELTHAEFMEALREINDEMYVLYKNIEDLQDRHDDLYDALSEVLRNSGENPEDAL